MFLLLGSFHNLMAYLFFVKYFLLDHQTYNNNTDTKRYKVVIRNTDLDIAVSR